MRSRGIFVPQQKMYTTRKNNYKILIVCVGVHWIYITYLSKYYFYLWWTKKYFLQKIGANALPSPPHNNDGDPMYNTYTAQYDILYIFNIIYFRTRRRHSSVSHQQTPPRTQVPYNI